MNDKIYTTDNPYVSIKYGPTTLTRSNSSLSIGCDSSPPITIDIETLQKELKKIKQNTLLESDYFTDIKEIVNNKVYLFTFADGTEIKTICDEEDEFDFEFAFYLALAKKNTKK